MASSPHSVGRASLSGARVSSRPAWRQEEKEGMNTIMKGEGKTKSGSDTFYELSKLTDVLKGECLGHFTLLRKFFDFCI